MSEWISIRNSGGLANDLVIAVLPFANFQWIEATGPDTADTTYGDALPLAGYIEDHAGLLPSRMYAGEATTLGYEGNAARQRETFIRITDQVSETHGISEVAYSFLVVVWLSYVDYMEPEHDEYYYVSVGSDGKATPMAQFLRLNAEYGGSPVDDYYEKHGSLFVVKMLRQRHGQVSDQPLNKCSAWNRTCFFGPGRCHTTLAGILCSLTPFTGHHHHLRSLLFYGTFQYQ